MKEFKIVRFKRLLVEELILTYDMDELTARDVVENSTVGQMLKESPEFIMHYSIEDNAEEIRNEYCGTPMEM